MPRPSHPRSFWPSFTTLSRSSIISPSFKPALTVILPARLFYPGPCNERRWMKDACKGLRIPPTLLRFFLRPTANGNTGHHFPIVSRQISVCSTHSQGSDLELIVSVSSPTILSGSGCNKGVAYYIDITLCVSTLVRETTNRNMTDPRKKESGKRYPTRQENNLSISPRCAAQGETLRESYAH